MEREKRESYCLEKRAAAVESKGNLLIDNPFCHPSMMLDTKLFSISYNNTVPSFH